jgi:hypothetical protein
MTEGKVVRNFRHPSVHGDDVCPLCSFPYQDHGWIDQPDHTPVNVPPDLLPHVPLAAVGQDKGPEYPGMVCPGDWILKTVVTPGRERYVIKRLWRTDFNRHPSDEPAMIQVPPECDEATERYVPAGSVTAVSNIPKLVPWYKRLWWFLTNRSVRYDV